jgi:hypothetical protein
LVWESPFSACNWSFVCRYFKQETSCLKRSLAVGVLLNLHCLKVLFIWWKLIFP